MKMILVGGFLGSGKTTAIAEACRLLASQGKRVAVITNDQGDNQVDSAYMSGLGIRTAEVSNGCFCCRYDELDAHVQVFENVYEADVVFAESVGSCTDLVATVAKPLLQCKLGIALTLSVFADASMLAAWIEGHTVALDESVQYIYRKQLEEADIIVINKTDLITRDQLALIDRMLRVDYENKTVVHQNSFKGEEVTNWLSALDRLACGSRNSLALDYAIYGAGEARMAWLDSQLVIDSPLGNGAFVVQHMVSALFNKLRNAQLVIGHLKFYVDSGNWKEKISFTTATTSADVRFHAEDVRHVRLLINARAQSEPDTLSHLVDAVLAELQQRDICEIRIEHQHAFKPGFPKPKHRMA